LRRECRRRRLAVAAHFGREPGIPGALCEIEHILIEAPVGFTEVHHLAAADEGVKQFWLPLHGQHTQNAAPRFAEHVNFWLVEPLAQIVGEFDGVIDRLIQRQRRGGIEGRIRFAGAALISIRDHNIAGQVGQLHPCIREATLAWPAVQIKQHRFVRAIATNQNGLIVPAQPHRRQFGDAVR